MGRWIEMAQPREKPWETGHTGVPKNPINPKNLSPVASTQAPRTLEGVNSVNWVNWKHSASVQTVAPEQAAKAIVPPPAAPSRHDPDTFRHGRSITGNPKTWTGRIVTIEEWRRLSEWDRHGTDGRLWCGICRDWVQSFPDCHGEKGRAE